MREVPTLPLSLSSQDYFYYGSETSRGRRREGPEGRGILV